MSKTLSLIFLLLIGCTTHSKMQEAKNTIELNQLKRTISDIAAEIKRENPELYFHYSGIVPVNDEKWRYDSSPTNTKIFAQTGGDGVHYSILELSDSNALSG